MDLLIVASDVDRNTSPLDRGENNTGHARAKQRCPAALSPTHEAWLVFQTLHLAFSIVLHID